MTYYRGKSIPKPKMSKLETKIQNIALWIQSKVSFMDIDFLDNVALLGPKVAISYLYDKVYRTITFAHFRLSLKNGFEYFKVGFKTEDYDSYYALEEFAWKLGRIRKHLTKHDLFTNVEKECVKIQRVEDLINRVLEDNYVDEFLAPITEKYGESTFDFVPIDPEEQKKHKIKLSKMVSKRTLQTDMDEKDIRALEYEAYKKAEILRNKEWKEALKIIEKNIFAWWD